VDLSQPLGADRLAALDAALKRNVLGDDVARVKIWNRDGRVVYSDDATLVGRRFATSAELRTALAGSTASEVSTLSRTENVDERHFGRLLEVYVPLRGAGATGSVVGAFELYLPYGPIAASITHDTHTIYLLVAVGLALLWLVLFRIVQRASRSLRRQVALNEHQAFHDALTDLPNRTVFRDRVVQAVAAARRSDEPLAVMIMDLDRFKEINDTLGHHTGDMLLQEIGPRLRAEIREADTVARLGGDEFGILLPRVSSREEVEEVAQRIATTLNKRFSINELSLEVDASIGIAMWPEHGTDADLLIQRADVAMYTAKENDLHYAYYASERDGTAPSGSPSSASCAKRSSAVSWCSTTNRSWSRRRGRCVASRRWCAGNTPSVGCSCPTSSSPWPSTPI
jgi:diguanylate cyclase (GGDEF)-like protein